MANPRIEIASGAVDGVNRIFSTPDPYISGTLQIFVNGQLKRKDFDDGFDELVPSSGTFELKEAPVVEDVVQAYFLDTLTNIIGTAKGFLFGILEDRDMMLGCMVDKDMIWGVLEDQETLEGSITLDGFTGVIVDSDLISGGF